MPDDLPSKTLPARHWQHNRAETKGETVGQPKTVVSRDWPTDPPVPRRCLLRPSYAGPEEARRVKSCCLCSGRTSWKQLRRQHNNNNDNEGSTITMITKADKETQVSDSMKSYSRMTGDHCPAAQRKHETAKSLEVRVHQEQIIWLRWRYLRSTKA